MSRASSPDRSPSARPILTPYRWSLLVGFCLALAWGVYRPLATPLDLGLHHVPTLGFVIWLVVRARRHTWDDLSYTAFFIFLLLHIVGAKYLYSNVPYDRWSESCFGSTISQWFGWKRNHYDRLVHFLFGVLFFHPATQVFRQRLPGVRARTIDLLSIQLIVVAGTIYELLEWGVAVGMAPDTADHYNGQQGDIWDAQRDMALALAGALIAAVLAAIGRLRHSAPSRERAT
ncbi:MAG: DUF2238 domain-containing protein [Planctomycetes bacterium]|nr:DUF2238 domain-containing protein [Planctomycetota bacterium]